MRLLLVQNMRYVPSHGGANRSNRVMLEGLAARGHDCVAVAPLAATRQAMGVGDLLDYLAGHGVAARVGTDAVVFDHNGVEAHVVTAPGRLPAYAQKLAARVAPDRTLVPSDDPGLLMLGTALRATPDRVVYLAHTLQQLPFGPRTFYPSGSGRRLVGRAAGVVAVSRAAQEYLRRWGGLDAELIYPPVYPTLPRPVSDGGAVGMVNPCGYKGISILLGLADAHPQLDFLAVPTWGTTTADRAQLARRRNIEVVAAVDDLGEVLSRLRVLLMPSLWDETFGYTAVEAMLAGVPVLASDVGGLREAMLDVAPLLPVNPITAYRAQRADEAYPEPVVPEQDLVPWSAALRRMVDDPAHHRSVAGHGRRAAAAFVAGLDIADLERYLTDLTPKPAPADPAPLTAAAPAPAAATATPAAATPTPAAATQAPAAALGPDRQRALELLLARRARA